MGREEQVVVTPAAQQLVGGLLLPRAVAGHPGLELCNTLAGWGEPEPHDYLLTYRHLVALARSLGLVTAAQARTSLAAARAHPRRAGNVLTSARALRSDLYAVLVRHDRVALPRLNAALAQAASSRRISSAGAGAVRWSDGEDDLRQPLVALTWQAHRLLSDDLASRVRACPGEGCGWLFVDPRGQRRWCVMSLCGNRAKARRHAARARISG
ncbi:MAG: CGNR zinc finger domain-containing protein [Actinomycetes bacterium]